MDLSVLTPRMKEDYEKITKELKSHPTETVLSIARRLGANSSYYYQARKRLGLVEKSRASNPKRVKRKKITMLTLPVDDSVVSSKIVALIGDHRTVIDSIREILR